MNQIIKYTFCFLLVLVIACQQQNQSDPVPIPAKLSRAKLSIVKGNNQTAFFAAFLTDSLELKVTPIDTTSPIKFKVTYKMTEGNGYIENIYQNFYPIGILQPDKQGKITVRWSLGCNTMQQKVTFYLYSDSCSINNLQSGLCKPIDSLSVEATGKKPSGWSKACGLNGASLYSTSFTSYQERIYAVNGGKAFYSEDEGINWKVLPTPNLYPTDQVRFLKCNSQGHIYILTENSGIFYSTTQGNSWSEINNGILDHRYPLDFVVEDNALFVSFAFDGIYRTTDNGKLWRKLLVEGKYHEEYHLITRSDNGDLFLFDKWSDLFKSTNNGDTWIRQVLEYKYKGGSVSDMETDNEGNLVIGSDYDGYVSVLSPETLTGNVVSFYTPETHSTCGIYQITPYQNKLYFVVVGNLKPGVYMGSQGNYTYAHADFNQRIESFFIKKDGSLLLATYDGVYYFAN